MIVKEIIPALASRFEVSRSGATSNSRSMEGLRGIAVFLVFLVHYVTLIAPWLAGNPRTIQLARAISVMGNTGVDLFFVLSGYLIYGSLIARPQKFNHFMARRIERIYPAFSAVFVTYVALSFLFPSESRIPHDLIGGTAYLALNFLLLPGLLPIEPMITVAWSLSYEMFYYLIIPLTVGVFGLRSWDRELRVWFFLIIALSMLLSATYIGGHVRLIMFISGILLHEAIASGLGRSPGGLTGLMALAIGLAVKLLPIDGAVGFALKFGILFISFYVLCYVCFKNPQSWLPRSLSWTPCRWLGNMSYSYYLLHGLALKACFLALSIVLPTTGDHHHALFWLLMPFMFGLTLIPSTILFLAVERPYSLAPRRARAGKTSP